MTHRLRVHEIQDRLRSAMARGEHCKTRESYLELLQTSKVWLLEVQQSDSLAARQRARQLTESLESIATLLNRNEQLVRIDAPFLIGERVEIERVEFGLRFVWVRGTVTDFRPAAIRARQLRNPRAMDYLVRENDGEERWRADEGIRRRTD